MAKARLKLSHRRSLIGPSGVRALPLAAGRNEGGHNFRYILVREECVRCPWLLAQTKVATILHTFLVRAALCRRCLTAVGHYFRYILVRAECVRCPWLLAQTKVATILHTFFHLVLFLPPLFKTTEGVVVLFQIFACGPELPIE